MPFGTERIAATYAREILRVVSGAEVAENAVVDGMSVALNSDNRRVLESGTVMVYAGANAIKTLTLGGVSAGDTYTLTYSGQTTAAIAADTGTAAEIQAALVALSNIAAGDVSAQGPVGGPFKIYFMGALAATAITLTSTPTGCTATIASVRTGAAAAAGAGQKVKPCITTDAAAIIAGIVMHTTEIFGGVQDTPIPEQSDAPVALYTKNCHFATAQLTGYSGNSANIKTAMTGAGNDKCANCTFE